MALKILFVDDDSLILSAVKRSLAREGFEIHTTLEPLDAVKLIAAHHIDVVVSDYMMPGMNGVELLSLVRRLHPKVTRIMMTGQADRDATIRAINEGAVSRYVEKPWDDAALKRMLNEISVDRHMSEAAAFEEPTGPRLRSIIKDKTGAIVLPAAE
ncbi:MAG: response regulator [Deltaproteobacteria bacterium]|nr:response regulator [Deltaproteobacteria bacterium]